MGEEDENASRMRVVVRIRPMNTREKDRNDKEIIQQLDQQVILRFLGSKILRFRDFFFEILRLFFSFFFKNLRFLTRIRYRYA